MLIWSMILSYKTYHNECLGNCQSCQNLFQEIEHKECNCDECNQLFDNKNQYLK